MAWSGKHLMRAGIVLLGFQLALADVLGLGWKGVGLIALVVAGSFGGTYLIAKALKLPGDQPVLLASGFSICGASAIGAMSHARGSSKDAPIPVALVTLCGTLAIAVLPLANTWLHLNELDFGRWVGASVHDVGQVVATAQGAGITALGAAVVVKLVRVLMLAPISVLGSISAAHAGRHCRRWPDARCRRSPTAGAALCARIHCLRPAALHRLVAGFGAAGARSGRKSCSGLALVGLGFAIDLRQLFSTAGRACRGSVPGLLLRPGPGFVACGLASRFEVRRRRILFVVGKPRLEQSGQDLTFLGGESFEHDFFVGHVVPEGGIQDSLSFRGQSDDPLPGVMSPPDAAPQIPGR